MTSEHAATPIPGMLGSPTEELAYDNGIAYGRHQGNPRSRRMATMLAGTVKRARALTTHRFPIEEAAGEIRVTSESPGGAIKVVMEPT